jgi:hypothetical protein
VLSIRTPVDTSRPSRTTQKAGPDSAGAVRASTNVVGVVHLKPLFPEQIQTSLSTPFEVGAHLRFDHGDLAQSQGPLCGGVSNVVGCCEKNTGAWGIVEAVNAKRAVDCQIRNSLEPHNRTAILGSNRPYVQIRVRMVRRSAILQTGAPKHGSTRW